MLQFKAKVRRFRFWKNLTIAYIKRYQLWFISSLLVFLSLAFFLYKTLPKLSKANTLTMGVIGAYSLENIPSEILTLATEPLISVDASGKPIPALASHWTVSGDGKTYVVFLKDNLKWHDNTLISAKDITIALENVQISALNNKAIEFKLPGPVSSFPTALNKPVFKSKSFYGTGIFRIVNIEKKDNIVRKINLVPSKPNLPNVEIYFYPTEAQTENAIKVGEIKSAFITQGKQFELWPNLEISKEPDNSQTVTIFFNTQDPQLSSKELRQALSYAINRESFDGTRANSPISPSSWAFNPQVKRYEYNTSKAKELLNKASIKNLKISLSVAPGFEGLAKQIKSDWEALGITTTLVFEKSVPKRFQALLAINKLNPDPDQYALWHSSHAGSTNITNYTSNKKIDKLLEDGRSTQDEKARLEIYQDFQKFLVEDEPAIFLYHPYRYQVTYKNAKPLLDKLPKQP